MRSGLIVLCVLMLPLLSACSTNPATGEQSFTAFMSPEEEIQVGREQHPAILERYGGVYGNPALQGYITQMGTELARVSDLPNLTYTFTVLNDTQVNAFALPGGYVYITRGLLVLAENDAEVASVLAHEIGHITARHSAERYSQAVAANIGLTVFSILGATLGAPAGIGDAVGAGADLVLKSYSREQELEADLLAVRYMSKVRYDPQALRTFFEKMQLNTQIEQAARGQSGDPANSLLSTHPKTADRIAQAFRLANAQPVPNPRVGRQSWQAQIKGVAFGEDRNQGITDGREFKHPDLGFAFRVPQGFTITNGQTQILARDNRGAVIQFEALKPEAVRAAGGPEGYVRTVQDGRLQAVSRLRVNNMPAAAGGMSVATQDGARDLRVFVVVTPDGQPYRFLFLNPPSRTPTLDPQFRETALSFRLLSQREAADITGQRIVLHQVRQGDTVASLAARQPFGKFNEARFRSLNLNALRDGLQPGETVKLVLP